MKTEIKATKAYQIDMTKISDGFLYSPIYVHAESINKAKSALLNKIRHEGLELLYSKEEITYMNIPVVRYEDADLHEFEGQYLTLREIEFIEHKRKRMEYLTGILNVDTITHCYIKKHGSYYRPNAAGYTQFRSFAGVYEKRDAVSHGKSCDDLQIIPIDKVEHNRMIEDEIKDFQTRLI